MELLGNNEMNNSFNMFKKDNNFSSSPMNLNLKLESKNEKSFELNKSKISK